MKKWDVFLCKTPIPEKLEEINKNKKQFMNLHLEKIIPESLLNFVANCVFD